LEGGVPGFSYRQFGRVVRGSLGVFDSLEIFREHPSNLPRGRGGAVGGGAKFRKTQQKHPPHPEPRGGGTSRESDSKVKSTKATFTGCEETENIMGFFEERDVGKRVGGCEKGFCAGRGSLIQGEKRRVKSTSIKGSQPKKGQGEP